MKNNVIFIEILEILTSWHGVSSCEHNRVPNKLKMPFLPQDIIPDEKDNLTSVLLQYILITSMFDRCSEKL